MELNEKENKHLGLKTVGSLGLVGAGIVGVAITPLMYIPLIYGSIKLAKNLTGDYIKDNLFSVNNKNFIAMSMYNPSQFVNLSLAKESIKEQYASNDKAKVNVLTMSKIMNQQMLSLFCQLDRCDNKGEPIKYTTTTHTFVYNSLLKLQKQGFIEGLPDKEELEDSCKAKTKSLWLEKLLLGNFKNWGEKKQFYNISFSLTDKAITQDDVKRLLKDSMDKCDIELNEDGSVKNVKWKTGEMIKTKLGTIKEKLFGKTNELDLEEKSTPASKTPFAQMDIREAIRNGATREDYVRAEREYEESRTVSIDISPIEVTR